MKTKLLAAAIAAFSMLSAGAYADDVVSSSDLTNVDKWYGRAGGLVGSDRVSGLTSGGTRIGVSYDADVAARTNMGRTGESAGQVGVTFDSDVAARTNMPRTQPTQVPATAGIEGNKRN
jgi:hypothetical protein